MPRFVVGHKRIKVGDKYREPGEDVPEAADWPYNSPWFRSEAVLKVDDFKIPAVKKTPRA